MVYLLRKFREGIDAQGNICDRLELSAGDWVPNEIIRQVRERVPPEAGSASGTPSTIMSSVGTTGWVTTDASGGPHPRERREGA